MQRLRMSAVLRWFSGWAILLFSVNGLVAQSGDAGCRTGPYTACTNPVPATYLSGSWIEQDGASEWQITANAGAPMTLSQVSGWTAGFTPPSSIIVFPIVMGCPVVYYTVDTSASFYNPSSITSSVEGKTTFQWKAINPTPNTACGGYTPVTWQQFNGTIVNKGNDTGSGTWKNSGGGTGSLAIETNQILSPTGETLALDTTFSPTGFGIGAYQTTLLTKQTLQDTLSYDPPDPNQIRFQGRQVYETANGTATDECYQAAISLGKTYPGGSAAILGSVWNVGLNQGSGNDYGYDNLGWTTVGIDWYRANLPATAFPCTATVPQAMTIVRTLPGYSNYQFATHTIKFTIQYPHGVVVSKDGITGTSTY